jgi:Ligated ion channel L-glutamate- and glycine-binding site
MLFIRLVSVFLLLNIVQSQLSDFSDNKIENLVSKFHEVVLKSFVKNLQLVNVVTAAKNSEVSGDFLEEFLKKMYGSFAVELNQHKSFIDKIDRKKEKNIILLDDFYSFCILETKINLESYHGLYIFLLVNGKIEEIENIFIALWKKNIYNVIVVYEEKDSVKVVTFLPFEGSKCGDTTPKMVGEFRNGQFLGNFQSIFPEKFKDLHECPIKVVTFEEPLSVVKEKKPDGNFKFSGIDVDLLDLLANILNFKTQISFLEGIAPWGTIHSNGSADGAFGEVVNGKAQIGMGNYILQPSRLKIADSSISYHSLPLVFILSGIQKMSIFEKLVKPFDRIAWIVIIVTFGLGVSFILIIEFKFKKFRAFIFGTGIRHPVTNMIMVILGVSQPKLPMRNFSRFLLMMFLIQCLVLRNAYQGSLYKFLRKDEQQQEPTTINDLVDQDYEFVLIESLDINFSSKKSIK